MFVDISHVYMKYWASQVVLVVENLPTNAGNVRDSDSIPELGKSLGEGNSNPLQYSCLEDATAEEPGSPQGRRESDTTSDLAHMQT